jgi:lysophospholipase L1-like esterase
MRRSVAFFLLMLLVLAAPALAQQTGTPSQSSDGATGYTADKVYDGNTATYGYTQDTTGSWWQVDFGAAVTLSAIQWVPSGTDASSRYAAGNWILRRSDNGSTWTDVLTFDQDAANGTNAQNISGTGRYWRLTGLTSRSGDLRMSFAEVTFTQNSGTATATPTPTATATPTATSSGTATPRPYPLGPYLPSSIVAVGDSITSGVSCPSWLTYMPIWRNVTYVNKGVDGNTTSQMLARMTDVLATNADAVLIFGGTNDVAYSVPIATTAANLDAMVVAVRAAGKVPILVGPMPRPGVSVTAMQAVRTTVRDLAATADVRYIDPWPAFDDGTGQMVASLQLEGAHPNHRGAFVLAREIAHGMGWGFLGD